MIKILQESDKFSHIAGVTFHATNRLARKSQDKKTVMLLRKQNGVRDIIKDKKQWTWD